MKLNWYEKEVWCLENCFCLLLASRCFISVPTYLYSSYISDYNYCSQVTRLPSGITVATLESRSPVARLAFVHNAGTRYENGNNRGVTHAVRSCIMLVCYYSLLPNTFLEQLAIAFHLLVSNH